MFDDQTGISGNMLETFLSDSYSNLDESRWNRLKIRLARFVRHIIFYVELPNGKSSELKWSEQFRARFRLWSS